MSFRCDQCNTVQADCTKPNKVVVETRDVTYENKHKTSTGTEIVREVNLCKYCVEEGW